MSDKNYRTEREQTQEKLRIYSSYLEVYLLILLHSPYVNSVNVYDMMAGKGGVGGSADKALDIIEDMREKFPQKKINLYLNDIDEENHRSLANHTEGKRGVYCQKKDVNDAIRDNLRDGGADKNFFYLDPYGFDVKKESIAAIVGNKNNECLWFVPVTNTRFATEQEKKDKITRFLNDYGIEISGYKNAGWYSWGKILKESFKDDYHDKYVGMAMLDTDSTNYYALYFIGNHPRGLEKFMETAKKKENKGKGDQLLFTPEAIEPSVAKLIDYLSVPCANNELYKYMLREGWNPSEAGALLRGLEERKEIFVTSKTGEERKKGAFYLTDREHKIDVRATKNKKRGEKK